MPKWNAVDHRKDAKLVQDAMQRIAERRLSMHATHRQPPVYVPIEDASDLLMALHHVGIYRPEPPEPDHSEQTVRCPVCDQAFSRTGLRIHRGLMHRV